MLSNLFGFPLFAFIMCIIGKGFLNLLFYNSRKNNLKYPIYLELVFGLFAIGFISLLVNFILPVYHFLTYLMIFVLFVYGLILIKKTEIVVGEIYWLIFITSILSLKVIFMEAGYDGGLYHLPHQLHLRNEKIIFGMANLHHRFGFSSLLEYINAPLWIKIKKEDFTLLAYTQLLFITVFLLFIYEKLRNHTSFTKFLTFSLLIGLLFIIRNLIFFLYTYTDVPTGIIFSIAFLKGYDILITSNNKEDLKIFLFLVLYAIMLKLSAIILLFWAIYVLLVYIQKNKDSLYEILKTNIILLMIFGFWLFKNFIISGCFFYPVSYSCMDVAWNAKNEAISVSQWITAWARHPGSGLYSLRDWGWIHNYWLPTYVPIFKPIIIKLLFTAILLFVIINILKKMKVKKILESQVNLPFIHISAGALFLLISLSFWFINAPDIRFGIGNFVLLTPIFFLIIFYKYIKNIFFLPKWLLYGFFILLILRWGLPYGYKTSIKHFLELPKKDLVYKPLRVPELPYIEDKVYGFRPLGDDRCFLVEKCYPYDRPKPSFKFNYLYVEPLKK